MHNATERNKPFMIRINCEQCVFIYILSSRNRLQVHIYKCGIEWNQWQTHNLTLIALGMNKLRKWMRYANERVCASVNFNGLIALRRCFFDIGCARLVAFGIYWKWSAPRCEYTMEIVVVFTNNNQINIRALCRYVSDVEIIKILTIDRQNEKFSTRMMFIGIARCAENRNFPFNDVCRSTHQHSSMVEWCSRSNICLKFRPWIDENLQLFSNRN